MQTELNPLESLFKQLFEQLLSSYLIQFPSTKRIKEWDEVLNQWINDSTLPLFSRKSSSLRGSSFVHEAGRTLIITDNTPAQWIYRRVVLNGEKLTLLDISEALMKRSFPLAMMVKKSEREHLIDSQVSKGSFKVDNEVWKIAHIKQIALARTKSPGINDHIEHHRRFLSLDNMYIIRKDFSGIAEVDIFNKLIADWKNRSMH
jgi:hypothetical protein